MFFSRIAKMNLLDLKLKILNFTKKGFTLIELLIVVAIIGILAGIGVPMYNGYVIDAKVAKTVADIQTVKSAAKFIRVTTGFWPGSSWPEPGSGGSNSSLDPLSCYCAGGNTFTYNLSPLIKSTWKGPYMKSWPKNIMEGTYYFDFNLNDQNGDGRGNERVLWLDNGRGNSGKRFPKELSQAIDERWDDGNLSTGDVQIWQGSNLGVIIAQDG